LLSLSRTRRCCRRFLERTLAAPAALAVKALLRPYLLLLTFLAAPVNTLQKRKQSNVAFKEAISCWQLKGTKGTACNEFNPKKEKCQLCQKILQGKP